MRLQNVVSALGCKHRVAIGLSAPWPILGAVSQRSQCSRRRESLLIVSVASGAHHLHRSGAGSVLSRMVRLMVKRSAKMTSLSRRYVTDQKGKRTGVVLSLKRYSRLMEDLHDLAVVAERRDEKPVPADDMKKRLHKYVLL